MAQTGSAGSQPNAVDVLVMARERQRLDVAAVHETLVAKLMTYKKSYTSVPPIL